jgi:hypothetical protein
MVRGRGWERGRTSPHLMTLPVSSPSPSTALQHIRLLGTEGTKAVEYREAHSVAKPVASLSWRYQRPSSTRTTTAAMSTAGSWIPATAVFLLATVVSLYGKWQNHFCQAAAEDDKDRFNYFFKLIRSYFYRNLPCHRCKRLSNNQQVTNIHKECKIWCFTAVTMNNAVFCDMMTPVNSYKNHMASSYTRRQHSSFTKR